jgi:hypothetical protein
LHVHSTLSRDGTMSVAELAAWYRGKAYHFVAMGEHAEDMTEAKTRALVEECAAHSTPQLLMIPGIEFACNSHIHILGIGVEQLIKSDDHLEVIRAIHAQDGFAVLAHPRRCQWSCPDEILRAVDAAEIWNVGYDGKFLPSGAAPEGIRRFREVNPKLLAVASHDFHKKESFYDVAVEVDVAELTRREVLARLRVGAFSIVSRFFAADPQARVSRPGESSLRFLSGQLGTLRKVRDLLVG